MRLSRRTREDRREARASAGGAGQHGLALAVLAGLAPACQVAAPAPTTPDCAAAAETLASLQLGNYAPRDERARVVAREQRRCEDAHLTVEEAACVARAADRDTAERCSPRLPIDVDCAQAIARVRAAARKPPALDVTLEAQLERGFVVMQTACVEDAWPLDLKKCILQASSLEPCADKLTKDLRDKLTARVMDALVPR